MSNTPQSAEAPASRHLSLDAWAVMLALALVALARLGWLPGVTW